MENLSYIQTPVNFRYQYRTIPDSLAIQAKLRNEKEVFIFLNPDGTRDSISAKELNEKSKKMAQGLMKRGIKKGDIIALCLQNNLEGLLCIFGVIYAGGIALNILSNREDGSDMRDVLARIKAKALIISPAATKSVFGIFASPSDMFDKEGNATCLDIPTLKHFITSSGLYDREVLTIEKLLNQDAVEELTRLDPEDTAILFLTSGSTGEPKFIPVSHFLAMIAGHQLQAAMKYDPEDIIYTERKFFWVGGFPFVTLRDGVTIVTKTAAIPSIDEHCRFTLDAIEKENCTIAQLFPATIVSLNGQLSGRQSPLLKAVFTGGLPIPSTCYTGLGTLAARFTNCYGSTEAGPVTSLQVTELRDNLDFNSGPPLPGAEVKILDSTGRVARRGERGEIYNRSVGAFNGYFDDKHKTSEVLSNSRWFKTNDTGYIDNDGNLFAIGRQTDVILQGDHVHMASEVEGIMRKHPDVLDVVVVPVPDDVHFQLVCACVIVKPGAEVSIKDLKDFYDSKIVMSASEAFGGRTPKMILMFDDFPRVYTGKPDKKKLIQEAIRRKHEDGFK